MGKIYTKKGDKGKTKTFLGEMSKSDELAEALGAVDELNSWIGHVRQLLNSKSQITTTKQFPITNLQNIQTNLMKINATLAGSGKSALKLKSYEVIKLEKWIDKMTVELPQLTNFIYPVGEIQITRTVARRCERAVVRFFNNQIIFKSQNVNYKQILKYLNRLSDYLFTLARWVNFKDGVKEDVWKMN